jgi:hypothetical protein
MNIPKNDYEVIKSSILQGNLFQLLLFFSTYTQL